MGRLGGCLVLALATAACSTTAIFAVASVQPQDGFFFTATQIAQYQPIPRAQLTFELKTDSLLTVTFSAAGFVDPLSPPNVLIPSLYVQCRLDDKPCAPGSSESTTQFLFPQTTRATCCDSRAFSWANPNFPKGTHTVSIFGLSPQQGGSQADSVSIPTWSLVVHAYAP